MAIGYKVVKGSATKARARRHFRLRKRVSGTAERPRLVVSRSSRHLFVQVIDDTQGKTLAYASTMKRIPYNHSESCQVVSEMLTRPSTS